MLGERDRWGIMEDALHPLCSLIVADSRYCSVVLDGALQLVVIGLLQTNNASLVEAQVVSAIDADTINDPYDGHLA